MPRPLEKFFGRGAIPIEKFHIEPGWNGRDTTVPGYIEKILELKEYIRHNGIPGGAFMVKVVGTCKEDAVLYLRDGHRRLTAIRMLAEEGFIVEAHHAVELPAGTDDVGEIAIQFSANSSEHYTPIEQAGLIKRMIDKGCTDPAMIAQRIGRSRQTVDNLISLLEAPHEVKKYVLDKKISSTEAVKQIKADPEKAPERIKEAVQRAEKEGRPKVRPRDLKPITEKVDAVEAAKKIVQGMNGQEFEQFKEWFRAEWGKRG